MESKQPCSARDAAECADCCLDDRLMCRFDRRDLLAFLFIFLPFGAAAVAGLIEAGFWWAIVAWLACWVFFFFVLEGRVLCSHCPCWAEDGRVLRCHANYGVVKLWRYRPGPMRRWEQVAFLCGSTVFVVLPLAFMVAGRQYGMAIVALVAAISAGYGLLRSGCGRCVNFSCPANRVDRPLVDAYLWRNSAMRAAWEAEGYELEE